MEMFSSLNQDNLKTPYRYIIFLKTYFNIYFERKQFLEEKYKRLKVCILFLSILTYILLDHKINI